LIFENNEEISMENKTNRNVASQFDEQDPLKKYRSRFLNADPNLIYMDGNSLGRLPLATAERLKSVVSEEWGTDLIRSWNKGWWEAPRRVGDKIAQLVGAAPGQVIVSDSTSVNLFKLAASALQLRPQRMKIITDTLNFPSDLYILQGLVHLLGGRHEIVRIGSKDGDLTPDLEAMLAAIDENTALVTLSHVVYKSGYLYEMAAITEKAHQAGALVLWDLSHSVGAVSIELDAACADFAIGCTYKYLNGGPGSPAFLYVNKDLQSQASSPIWGWWGQSAPFAFGLDYSPAPGVNHFLAGSQPMLSILAMEASLDPMLEAGMEAIRRKSMLMTEYMITLTDEILAPLGFILGTPRNPERRGSHVSLRHPEGYRINRTLIDEMKVIPDFREPDNIRFGLAPLYTTFEDIWQTVERVRTVMQEKRFEKYQKDRLTVT
jgi:kynureninase